MLKKAVLGICLILAMSHPALAGTWATYSECQDGCPIGDQSCYSYCSSLFDPCFNRCAEEARNFIPNCMKDGSTYTECRDLLYITNEACKNACRTVKKLVDYPNWMAAQECPYDCQRWNPVSRTCVGAKMNGCGDW